ncbi:AMP-binding protein [Blattabacterium cuenoti]|uniref:AMP-binding protein n=1 Tax=Blattabacterium cuenoti TaxID=1653831 RepID=UPI00163CC514|nr:AMP-binding protein [Blattabacterium cuenoti]
MWIDFTYNHIFRNHFDSYWKKKIHSFIKDWYSMNPKIVSFTSGTTGSSKMIFLRKKYMYERALKTVEFLKLNRKKVTGLLCLPINSIGAKMFLIRAMIFKWKVFFVPPSSNPMVHIKNYFDIVSMTPMQVFYSIKKLQYVKILLIGGAPINKDLEKRLESIRTTDCYATYGMTETSGHIAIRKVNGWNKTLFYQPFNDISVDIDQKNCLKIRFLSNNKLFITNDIVQLVSKNMFIWIGRYDGIINSGGVKIIPEIVEKDLKFFIPNNKRFFLSSIPDHVLGEKLILVIESFPFSLKIPKSIFIGEKQFFYPKKIVFVPHFIENELGKIQKIKIVKKIINQIN